MPPRAGLTKVPPTLVETNRGCHLPDSRRTSQTPPLAQAKARACHQQRKTSIQAGLMWNMIRIVRFHVWCSEHLEMYCSERLVPRYLVPDTKYQALIYWYLMPGAEYLVAGTWHLLPWTWHPIPSTRYLAPGTWTPFFANLNIRVGLLNICTSSMELFGVSLVSGAVVLTNKRRAAALRNCSGRHLVKASTSFFEDVMCPARSTTFR